MGCSMSFPQMPTWEGVPGQLHCVRPVTTSGADHATTGRRQGFYSPPPQTLRKLGAGHPASQELVTE